MQDFVDNDHNVYRNEEVLPSDDVPCDNTAPVYSRKRKAAAFFRSQLLTVIQVTVCLMAMGAAAVLKAVGGDWYAVCAAAFYDYYNNSVLPDTAQSSVSVVQDVSISETSLFAYPDEKNRSADPNDSSTDVSGNDKQDSSAVPTLTDADPLSKLKQTAVPPLEKGIITSLYGIRENGTKQEFHKGLDIAADKNSPIATIADGTVLTADSDSSYGHYIVIQHEYGIQSLYAHCEKLLVRQGDTVAAGDRIALVGETGDADGFHLHLEILVDGSCIDPQTIIGGAYQ